MTMSARAVLRKKIAASNKGPAPVNGRLHPEGHLKDDELPGPRQWSDVFFLAYKAYSLEKSGSILPLKALEHFSGRWC